MGWFKPPNPVYVFSFVFGRVFARRPLHQVHQRVSFASQPGWGQAVGIDVLPMQDGFDKGKDAREQHLWKWLLPMTDPWDERYIYTYMGWLIF